MNQSNIEFLQSLIAIDSTNPPGNEAAVTELFKKRCDENEIPYEITDLGDNRNNFSVILKEKDTTEDKLLLSGHTDTVKIGAQQWQFEPFAATIDNGKLYGRGTTDMKSGLAALYLALESLYKEGFAPTKNIEFLATAGEEVDSIGAEQYVATTNMDNINAIIIAEPTSEKVVVGHKGALWIEVTLTGKTAHGAMPEQGINAIEGMNKVLNLVDDLKTEWVDEQPTLGKSSISANLISGGIQTNVIPDSCTLNVDIRSVRPNLHEKLYREFTERLADIFNGDHLPEVSTKILLNRATVLTQEDEPIITHALDVANAYEVSGVSYYTDGSVLNPDSDIPTLIYGPGIETLAHQPDEYVEVEAFEKSVEYFKKLIKSYTG